MHSEPKGAATSDSEVAVGHFAYENMPPKKRVLKKRRSQIDIIAQRKMVHDPNYKKGQMIEMMRR